MLLLPVNASILPSLLLSLIPKSLVTCIVPIAEAQFLCVINMKYTYMKMSHNGDLMSVGRLFNP
jgi:hypothetical protein